MGNERQRQRYKICFPIQVEREGKPERLGVSRDASPAGAMFGTRSAFTLGQHIELTFEIARDKRRHHVGATVVWVGMDDLDNPSMFPRRVAVRFDEELPDIEPTLAAESRHQDQLFHR